MGNTNIEGNDCLLVHKGTKDSPEIIAKKNGVITIKGSSLMLNAQAVYKPLCWALNKVESDQITLEVDLDAMNASTMKYINVILRIISLQSASINLKVFWRTDTVQNDDYYGRILQEMYPNVSFFFYS